ncbi:hypothetical protein M3Y97_00975500 [Aphelenchoides bicaudatus]|nr:hypothetical protein M3Y97_00975500 [Aphelenchoides bicaudatus]
MPTQQPGAFSWLQVFSGSEEMSRFYELIVMIAAYCVGIPLLLIYSRVVYVLIAHKKKFNSAFFQLVVVCGFMDCTQYVLSNFSNRLPRFGLVTEIYDLMDEPSTLYCVPFMLSNHLQLASMLGSFILTLNRFTTVTVLSKNTEFRWRLAIPYMVGFLLIFPFIVMINFLFAECQYIKEIRYATFTYKVNVIQTLNLINYKLVMLLCGLIVSLPTFIFNVLTFVKLAQHHEKQGTKREIREQYQLNLTIMTFMRFSTDLIFVAYSLTSYLLSSVGETSVLKNVHFYFYTLNDVISLTPGIVLFLGSRRVREVVLGQWIWDYYTGARNNSTVIVMLA